MRLGPIMSSMKRPTFLDQATRARDLWRVAWADFGAWRGMLTSPYFWLAAILTAGCYPLWLGGDWWDISVSVVPSLLGFSIGGFAIFLAFGDERFRMLISGPDDSGRLSPFLAVCVQFSHFVVVQAVALLYAMIAKAIEPLECKLVDNLLGMIGVMSLFYSLTLALAAFASLLKLARSYDRFAGKAKQPPPEKAG